MGGARDRSNAGGGKYRSKTEGRRRRAGAHRIRVRRHSSGLERFKVHQRLGYDQRWPTATTGCHAGTGCPVPPTRVAPVVSRPQVPQIPRATILRSLHVIERRAERMPGPPPIPDRPPCPTAQPTLRCIHPRHHDRQQARVLVGAELLGVVRHDPPYSATRPSGTEVTRPAHEFSTVVRYASAVDSTSSRVSHSASFSGSNSADCIVPSRHLRRRKTIAPLS